MKRRTFLKAVSAGFAALGAGVGLTIEKTKETYSHWNQAFKGEDRRRWIKRDSVWSHLPKGPEGKMKRTNLTEEDKETWKS